MQARGTLAGMALWALRDIPDVQANPAEGWPGARVSMRQAQSAHLHCREMASGQAEVKLWCKGQAMLACMLLQSGQWPARSMLQSRLKGLARPGTWTWQGSWGCVKVKQADACTAGMSRGTLEACYHQAPSTGLISVAGPVRHAARQAYTAVLQEDGQGPAWSMAAGVCLWSPGCDFSDSEGSGAATTPDAATTRDAATTPKKL